MDYNRIQKKSPARGRGSWTWLCRESPIIRKKDRFSILSAYDWEPLVYQWSTRVSIPFSVNRTRAHLEALGPAAHALEGIIAILSECVSLVAVLPVRKRDEFVN